MKELPYPITKYTRRGSLFSVALAAMKEELRLRKMKVFTYCPCCKFELTTQSKITENKDGTTYHVCINCGAGSQWDYNCPVPILLT